MTQSTNQQCRLYPINFLTKHDIYTDAEMQMHTYFIIITCCKFVFWFAFSLNCKFWCPVYFKFAKSRVLFLYWFAFDVSWAPEIVTCIFRTVKLNCNSLNNYIFIDIYYYSWSFLVCSTYCKHHLQPRKVVQGMLR